MTRIAKAFEKTRNEGRPAIIPFLTGGYPTLDSAVPLILAAEAAGADLLEIGLPFSDPLADGPAIQLSSQRAIENGATLKWILQQVKTVRETSQLPLILMGYLNPMLRYGLEEFAQGCVKAGVDGLIVPDLLPEESEEFARICDRHGLSNVFLMAPTSSVDLADALVAR
ncbi:MAG: tryptophan synthase subunit alpha, partial [Planctomycetota bacterium]